MALLSSSIPGLRPVVAAASGIAEAVAAHGADWAVPPIIVREVAERYDAFAAASAALTKSGTSTLELAMAGVAMAVTYRVNPLSAAMAKRMIKVKHVAMINLLAGRSLVPELLQAHCAPERLAAELGALLNNPAAAAAQRAGFAEALNSLRAPSGTPSAAAAAEIMDLIKPARKDIF
jgi:lipid-A-disaccharide synthase